MTQEENERQRWFDPDVRQYPIGEAARLLRGVRSESDQENRDDPRREAFRQRKGHRLAGF